jgi:hypothetical protein
MYLAFLFNVFYMLCILIFIYIIDQYFLSDALWNMFIYMIRVECVRVGYVANLCVTRSGTMYLTWTCEMRGSRIVLRILGSLRMMTVVCYLVYVFVYLLFIILVA